MARFNSLTGLMSSLLALAVGGPGLAQSVISGSVTVYDSNTGAFQSISGQLALPSGLSFPVGTTAVVTPGAAGPAPLLVNSLTIAPSLPGFIVNPPSNPNQQAAVLLNGLTLPGDLPQILSIIRGGANLADNSLPAMASGNVTYGDGTTFLQSISGEVSLQAGRYAGPLYLEPQSSNPISINALVISPGAPTFDYDPTNLNAAAARQLNNAATSGNLSDQVSILRAGQGLFDNTSRNQSTASGSATLVDTTTGFTQTVSGQAVLPNGLFYRGADVFTSLPGGACPTGGGCLYVSAVNAAPGITSLSINPGEVNQITPPGSPFNFDFNAQAAILLTSQPNLSNRVSYIRAAVGSGGPLGSTLQGSVSGSSTITTSAGATQSVSGEISLPPGLYFENTSNSAACGSASPGSCFTLIPAASTTIINNLSIDPGNVQPGDPTSTAIAVSPLDFNARAAKLLYDTGGLANIVSLIRAGTSAGGFTTNASQASARASGATTITLPNGAVQSVTGDISLQNGQFYNGSGSCPSGGGCLTITPALSGPLDTNPSITSLTVDPGPANTIIKPWTFEGAAAYALQQQPGLSGQVSIIRAASGDGGLD